MQIVFNLLISQLWQGKKHGFSEVEYVHEGRGRGVSLQYSLLWLGGNSTATKLILLEGGAERSGT